MSPKKVLVVAPVLSRSGYGVHARFVVDALSTRPDLFDLYIHPLNWGESSWLVQDSFKKGYYENLIHKKISYQGHYDISVQVTVPTEWAKAAKVNIGVTAGVETDKVPLNWLQVSNSFDKLIVTSDHTAKGFLESKYELQATFNDEKYTMVGTDTPVEVVGYPIKDVEPTDITSQVVLEPDFNFLTITQLAPRKNMEHLIRAFVEEFRDENVGLLLKCHAKNNSTMDEMMIRDALSNFINQLGPRKCKVYHIHGCMTDEEIAGLYSHPKIKSYVTTTHGEGFGLPIFEASYSGLPVIAPAWSGHIDFLYCPEEASSGKIKNTPHFEKISYDLVPVEEVALMEGIIEPGMQWCEPKFEKTRAALRNVYRGHAYRQKMATDLKDHNREKFSVENQHKMMCAAVWSAYDSDTTRWKEDNDEIQIL